MLQLVFCEINIWKRSGESRIGAKEILNLPAFQFVILDRPHPRIWRQFHANVIALVKHNASIELFFIVFYRRMPSFIRTPKSATSEA
jgi:hypothetical protein